MPLVEVTVRLGMGLDDVAQLVSDSRSEDFSRGYPGMDLGRIDDFWVRILYSAGMLVMVANPADLPVFCGTCETVKLKDYYTRDINRAPVCYRTERRGVEVTKIEIPCRDGE